MIEIILLVTTGVLTTLLAGVFFGYAVSVNWGLARLRDGEYVRAMQSINIVIQNPLFFLSFMGPVILLPLVTFLSRDAGTVQFTCLLAASIIYIVGSFGLTVAGNVPLNDKLAKLDAATASDTEFHQARQMYEKPWNRLHTIRTVASIIASALVLVGCVAM